MANLIALLSWRPDAGELSRDALTSLLRQKGWLAEPVAPGGRNAGDLLVRATGVAGDCPHDFGFGAIYDETVAIADGTVFEPLAGAGDPLASPIHRTALFCANRNPLSDRLYQFERETASLPRYVPIIRGWLLGRVKLAWGRFPWTYVWEQGFDRPDHLTRNYMMAPAHWGYVDRWFDPEHPDMLIDPALCHAFCDNPLGHLTS